MEMTDPKKYKRVLFEHNNIFHILLNINFNYYIFYNFNMYIYNFLFQAL